MNEQKSAHKQAAKKRTPPDAVIKAWIFDSGIWYRLTEGEKTVYVELRRWNKGGMTIMTREQLQKRVGMHRSSVSIILKSLLEKKALRDYSKLSPAGRLLHPKASKGAWVFYT